MPECFNPIVEQAVDAPTISVMFPNVKTCFNVAFAS